MSGPYGVMSQTLEETKAGVHALSKEQLRSVLVRAYSESVVPAESRTKV